MNPHVLLADISACLVFLTRLPIRVTGLDAARQLARSAWAFPVVGVSIGGIGAVVYAVAAAVGLTPLVAATLAVAALVAVTGALHEDGLADTVDGLGGGHDRETKLNIMRDSRLGGFGAVALILVLVGRIATLAAFGDVGLAAALVVAGAASRATVVAVMAALGPARDDGLGAAAGTPSTDTAVLAITIAVVVALMVLPAAAALAVLIGTWAAGGGLAWLAQRQIGGHTGDVLGAVQQVAEITALLVAAAILGS